MKYIIIILITLSQLCYAECDWKTITKSTGGYEYTVDCHLKVGSLVDENKRQKKIIDLQDLTIKKYDERVTYLQKRTDDLDNTIEYPKWAAFGLGILSMTLSVWAAGQLR